MNEPAQFLEWDSAFFNRRIAMVQGSVIADAKALLEWSKANRIDCLYFLAANDAPTIAAAESLNFSLTDIRVTHERSLKNLPDRPSDIRVVRPDDVERLKQLAAPSFTGSRFYADPHFPRAQCDAMYATWIERDCLEGRAHVLVTERDGEAVGFLTCRLDGGVGNMALMAVDPVVQGEGRARRLIHAALHYCADQGITRSTMVTQARNIASQRLYQSCGYLIHSTALWYHRWFTA